MLQDSPSSFYFRLRRSGFSRFPLCGFLIPSFYLFIYTCDLKVLAPPACSSLLLLPSFVLSLTYAALLLLCLIFVAHFFLYFLLSVSQFLLPVSIPHLSLLSHSSVLPWHSLERYIILDLSHFTILLSSLFPLPPTSLAFGPFFPLSSARVSKSHFLLCVPLRPLNPSGPSSRGHSRKAGVREGCSLDSLPGGLWSLANTCE